MKSNDTKGTTAMKFQVRRYRPSELAPSLSLTYAAKDHDSALAKHFERYCRAGIPSGDRYCVRVCGWDAGAGPDPDLKLTRWYSDEEARRVLVSKRGR